jgi:TolB-like protein
MPDTRPSQRLARVILPAAVIAAVVAGLQLWSSNRGGARPWQASVAVMPFENRTGDPSLDVLGRSLAEEVINRLTTIPEIRVIDPYTAASLMNDSLGTPALLDTLNVDHVIHGYVEIRGGDLIVNVSESDREGFLSLRRQHRVDPGRLDVQQVALAGTITRSFLSSVGLEDRFDPGGSVIGPGRDAYLAGNTALGRRTPGGVREAIDHFHEAIALEPSSAAALAALSSAYALAVYYKYQVGPSAYELAARSLAAADSAISLDPTVANGYSARGYIRALIGLDIGQAEADFARAEALAPNAPNGPSWSAQMRPTGRAGPPASSRARASSIRRIARPGALATSIHSRPAAGPRSPPSAFSWATTR